MPVPSFAIEAFEKISDKPTSTRLNVRIDIDRDEPLPKATALGKAKFLKQYMQKTVSAMNVSSESCSCDGNVDLIYTFTSPLWRLWLIL